MACPDDRVREALMDQVVAERAERGRFQRLRPSEQPTGTVTRLRDVVAGGNDGSSCLDTTEALRLRGLRSVVAASGSWDFGGFWGARIASTILGETSSDFS